MSIQRAQELIADAVTEDGQAVDPATIAMLLQLARQLVSGCLNRKSTQAEAVAMIRNPNAKTKRKLREKLRAEIGSAEYKRRGGSKYADKVIQAGAKAKVLEVRKFVSEVSQECGS